MKKLKNISLFVFGRRNYILHKFCLLLITYNLILTTSSAQDLHFSQWFNSPLTTNPANTGFIPDADYRIGANYRNQWVNVANVPYKTFSIYGDAQIMRDKFETGWLGLGGVILRDVAGTGNLTSTKMYGSLAYHQMLGYSSLLTAGFNVGWAQKRIDRSKLLFPDQFNTATGFFEAGVPTEADLYLNNTSTSYFDVQVGLNYAYFPTENVYINGGFSVQHINRAKESFFASSSGFDSRIDPRYIAFVHASLKLNDQVIINPMAYFTTQAKSWQVMFGGSANYNLSGDGTTQLIGGLYYRGGDAIVPMLGFDWNAFRLTFSYDVTASGLKAYNGGRGAIEISLVKTGFYQSWGGSMRQSLCPKF